LGGGGKRAFGAADAFARAETLDLRQQPQLLVSGIAGTPGGLRERGVGSGELGRLDECIAEPEQDLRQPRVPLREERHRTGQQIGRGADVLTRECTGARLRKPLGRASAELRVLLSQLAPVAVRLLEVVADDLVTLDEV